jgi:hypothetical protein
MRIRWRDATACRRAREEAQARRRKERPSMRSVTCRRPESHLDDEYAQVALGLVSTIEAASLDVRREHERLLAFLGRPEVLPSDKGALR